MKIVCFGDSITHAAPFAECDRWPSIFQHKLNEWKPKTFAVLNRGIGGNTAAMGLDRVSESLAPHLPCIAIVQFGFNDATVHPWAHKTRLSLDEYLKNMKEFHRFIQSKKGLCIFIVNHDIAKNKNKQGNGKPYYLNLKPYNPALKALARKLKAPIIDIPAVMKRRSKPVRALVNQWDGIHLSPEGNHLYADIVFSGFQSIIPAYPRFMRK